MKKQTQLFALFVLCHVINKKSAKKQDFGFTRVGSDLDVSRFNETTDLVFVS